MVEQLDPQMAAAMARHKELRLACPLPEKPTLDDIRAQAIATRLPFNVDPPAVFDVSDGQVAGPFRDVPIRRYQPTAEAGDGPAILYVHGGGWFSCSLDTHDWAMRRLALDSGLTVIGIDPAQAPEFKFPKPLEEVAAVFKKIAEGPEPFRIDSARLAFAGCSSGANLALGAVLSLDRGLFSAGALFYGSFGAGAETASAKKYADGRYGIGAKDLAWTRKNYLNSPEDRQDPRAAPLLADLDGLPPLYLAAAQLDPLRDESLDLADRLGECNVTCEARVYYGLAHSNLVYASMVDAARGSIRHAAAHLRRHLADPVAADPATRVTAESAEEIQHVR